VGLIKIDAATITSAGIASLNDAFFPLRFMRASAFDICTCKQQPNHKLLSCYDLPGLGELASGGKPPAGCISAGGVPPIVRRGSSTLAKLLRAAECKRHRVLWAIS
jgi:hypothetical protein